MLLINREAAKCFGPRTSAQLAEVFDSAWKSVAASTDRTDFAGIADTRTLLAKYIIEIAKRGERDPKQLRNRALECLRRSNDDKPRSYRYGGVRLNPLATGLGQDASCA